MVVEFINSEREICDNEITLLKKSILDKELIKKTIQL